SIARCTTSFADTRCGLPAPRSPAAGPRPDRPPSSASMTAPCPGPFSPGYRAAGVLLHVTSLPSRHGIGDLGPSAFTWIDCLRDAGQEWWQGLPVGPTGWSDSPYQSLSSFAGNGLLISPDLLVEEELLGESDVE